MELQHGTFERSPRIVSEKIVIRNKEGIKGQIKELVQGSAEETLNELLEAEAESRRRQRVTSATKSAKATAAGTMTGV